MGNLKSYMSLGLGFLVILFSQVLAHKVPEAMLPISDVALDDHTEDSMKAAEFEESRKTTNMMIPHGLSSDSENDKVFRRVLPRGTISRAAIGTIKKNDIIMSEQNDYVEAPPVTEWRKFHANPLMKNGAKTVPGTRRLLKDSGEEI